MRRALSFIAVVVLVAAVAHSAEAARPNVLVLLTDDQGYGDFSCHGNPVLKTPNVDRLHAESIRFTDFHSAPMCTPTRGELMTGRDAVKNGATSVTAGRAILRSGLETIPELFARAGYKTGIFGKWHLGDNYPHRPMDKGFQEAYYHKGWGLATSAPEFENTLFDGRCFHNGKEIAFQGYCTDFWFDRAIDWMKQRSEAGEPFFCYLPTNAPHAPLVVDEKYSAPYRNQKGPANFFGMIANIDENLGRLEAFLKKTGLRDNTIIVFMTDNGGTAGVRLFNAGMRGHKTEYYDGGHRVPCFVRWPSGKLRAPGDIDVPTQVQDVLPTLLDLCGIAFEPKTPIDGVSLADLLRGKNTKLDDRMLVVQYGQIIEKWSCAVIWNQWRLVKGAELYDIKADPAQAKDVASKHPEVLARMRAHYEKWWAEVEPMIPDFVPIWIGAEEENPTRLTCSDWQDIYCDNAGHVRRAEGGPRGGVWSVKVARPGRYRFALRRWPSETNWQLDSAPKLGEGKALPIVSGKVRIDDNEKSGKANSDGREIIIEMNLTEGVHKLRAWFEDRQGRPLCGAFYTTITARD